VAVADPLGSAERLLRVAVYHRATRLLGSSFRSAARRAAGVTGSPIGLVTLVTDDAQWFAGHYGLPDWLLDIGGTPLEWSFCEAVVRSDAALWIEDLRLNARHAQSPWVQRAGVASYAGVPLRDRTGLVMGCVCTLSTEAKAADPAALAVLAGIARGLTAEVNELEQRESQPDVSAPGAQRRR
jgi:GAF domain-containing protein